MKTLAFCTAWADSDDAWRYRYGKWLAHLRASPLRASQILIIDDGSRVRLDLPQSVTVAADELPHGCPGSPAVVIHFAEHLGRRGVFDYPGWWRSFAFAADYAERYGFAKVVHIESDSFILSPRLHDHVNALQRGWVALWCPRSGIPETCIQVICPDQLLAYLDLAAQPYSALLGKQAELFLPFTRVESRFKGDRYGEYRTELPRDADYAAQIRWSTEVWCGAPPPPRRVLALTVGEAAVPPRPTLYPQDAWEEVASGRCMDLDELSRQLDARPARSLDALQVTLPDGAVATPLPIDAMRRTLGPNGELALRVRPNGNAVAVATLAQSLLERGFAGTGKVQARTGGQWILAVSAENTLGAVLGRDRLSWRLCYVARDDAS